MVRTPWCCSFGSCSEMPPLCESHSESPYLPDTDCEVLPRAGLLLISSFFQESEEERWRWYWNLLFNPWITQPHSTSPCHDFFWLNGAVSNPMGTSKNRTLAMVSAATAGEVAPWAVPSCSWIIPLLAQSPVWLGEQVSSLPSSWESPAASAEMEDPHHLPVLLAWPRHSLPCRVVPGHKSCPACRAAPLQLSWEHDGLWDSLMLPRGCVHRTFK